MRGTFKVLDSLSSAPQGAADPAPRSPTLMPPASRGLPSSGDPDRMRSRAVTGFVSKFTYRSAPHRSPAPQRVSDTQGVLPFAARGRRSAPRPPHGTARCC